MRLTFRAGHHANVAARQSDARARRSTKNIKAGRDGEDLLDAVVGTLTTAPRPPHCQRHDDVAGDAERVRAARHSANSAMTLPKFVMTSAIIKDVTRKPNSSRMRSLSPFPVTAHPRPSPDHDGATVVGIVTRQRVAELRPATE